MRCIALIFLASLALTRAAEPAPLILVSLDGFRWDYTDLHPAAAPTLRTLRREGVAARALVPVFPSNTFPNHYTLVTGLRPARHGIVNNIFFDPGPGMFFRYNHPLTAGDARWWGGEPIWATAIRQGKKAAASFWVGSEAEIGGVRPTFWKKFDYSIPFEKRLDELLGWLALPPAERPAVITFYLEETNAQGHRFGPDAPELVAEIKLSDDRIATLLARLRATGIEPNLVIVSDHGMTATRADRIVLIDSLIDLSDVIVEDEGSVLSLRPRQGDPAALVRAFAGVPHVKAYLAADLPEHFHFRGNPRIAPVWVLPDEGWHAGTRAAHERLRTRYAAQGYLLGDHGYDPQLQSMHGILIAHGPAFRRGVEVPATENIHVYNLLCAALGLVPAPNDGDNRLVEAAIRP
ncbi:MAG: ectonucleotide pyrophosphatase/phosphodiesterase [Opitutaceae bacterium]|nr:ectonucleotide pyrophosphatase/phosphodiesterase [Opitutaceae bacterium]